MPSTILVASSVEQLIDRSWNLFISLSFPFAVLWSMFRVVRPSLMEQGSKRRGEKQEGREFVMIDGRNSA